MYVISVRNKNEYNPKLNYKTPRLCQLSVHRTYCTYLNAKWILFLKFGSQICEVCLKFMYEGPKWTAPNWIALNQTMQTQTKTRIAKCKQKTQQCITKADTSYFLLHFRSWLYFRLLAKKHLCWWTLYIELFTVTGNHTSSKLAKLCTWEQT
jgi:hypothetical protein